MITVLCHGERHDTGNSHRCQQKREPYEAGSQHGLEALVGPRLSQDLLHGPDLGERQIGVHGLDNVGNALGDRVRIARSANRHPGLGPWRLPKGDINFGEVLAKLASPHVMEDADDLPYHRGPTPSDAWDKLINGNAVGKRTETRQVTPDKILVDDCGADIFGRVLLGEAATPDDANAKSVKVSWCHHLKSGIGTQRAIHGRLADNRESHAEPSASHRRSGCGFGARYAWNGFQLFQEPAVKRNNLLRLREPNPRYRKCEGQDVITANT